MNEQEQEEYMLLWRHCVGVMRSLKAKLRITPKQCPLCGSVHEPHPFAGAIPLQQRAAREEKVLTKTR